MQYSKHFVAAMAIILLASTACNSSRSTQDCVMFCEVASACEFKTQAQKDACYELCDSIEDNVPRLTGEMAVSKYFTCGDVTSCDEFDLCKKNVDESYNFLFEDGDAENEAEQSEGEDNEAETASDN